MNHKNIKTGYKPSELGDIPQDWDVVELEKLVVPGGLVRGPFGGALKKEFFVSSGYKVYEQKNAIYADVEIGNYFINESKFRELNRFAIQKGDFIISCSGTIGKIYEIPETYKEGIINQALLKITLNNLVFSKFFYWYFSSDDFQNRIIDNTQGGAMKNLIGMSDFKNSLFVLPPKPEQTAIATVLSDTDQLISALQTLITKKQAIKTATMQQLLTGKTRLPAFAKHPNGQPKTTQPSELGDIPEDWDIFHISKHAILKARIGWQALRTQEYLDSGEYGLVTGTDFDSGLVNWKTCQYVSEWRYNQDTDIQLKNNDVLVTKDRTIGKVGFIDTLPFPATLNSGIYVVRPKQDILINKFLFYILTSNYFLEFIKGISAGSTITHLYQKDFVNFKFLLPSKPEQTAIAQIMNYPAPRGGVS